MFIVNDEILENLTCSECKKYLSVKPVKCYPNMGIRCGRCATSSDAGAVSLFGVLAKRALFRCVNRFEGCNRLLCYEDVEEHERICVGTNYDCPCCVEPFSGTAYEIYVHFKQQHRNLLLNNTPEFSIEIDNETSKTYLYRKNDLLFYITANFTITNEELILNVIYLGTDRDASKITQMFELRSLDGKLQYKTKKKSCCSVSEGCLQYFKINVSQEEYPKGVVVCKVELMTNHVDSLVVLPEKYNESGKKENEEINNNNVSKDDNEDKENQIKSDGLKNKGENKKENQDNSSSILPQTPEINIIPGVKDRIRTSTPLLVTNKQEEANNSSQVQNSNAENQDSSSSISPQTPEISIIPGVKDRIKTSIPLSVTNKPEPNNSSLVQNSNTENQDNSSSISPQTPEISIIPGVNDRIKTSTPSLVTNKPEPNNSPLVQNSDAGVQSRMDPFSTASNLSSLVIDQGNPSVTQVLVPERKDTALNDLLPTTSRRDQPSNKTSLLDEPIPSGSGNTVIDANKTSHYLHNPIARPNNPMVNHQPFVFCQNNPPVYINQPSIRITNKTVNQVNNNIYIRQPPQIEIQKPTYPCTVCGRVITSQIGLWSHMRTHRPRSPSPPRAQYNKPRAPAGGRNQGGGGMFSCSECGRVISSQIGLWSHMRTHK